MKARRAAVAGIWLAFYATAGSVVGVVGFGLLWSGLARLAWARAAFGLALLLLGLDRAAAALNASVLARRAGRGGGRRGPPPTTRGA